MLTKKQKQLVEKVKNELLDDAKLSDIEIAHRNADLCLCELLEGFGLNDVLDAYKKIPKWYS
jgi:hypothetical protein